MQLLGKDGQLAGLRKGELAIHADDIAQVKLLGESPAFVADLCLADQELQVAGPILNVDELQLAGVAQQHDSTGCSDLRAGPLAFALILQPAAEVELRLLVAIGNFDRPAELADVANLAAASANLANEGAVIEAATPGIDAERGDFAELLAADSFEAVNVFGRWGRGRETRAQFWLSFILGHSRNLVGR